ncbi:MAG: hypothetical protein K2O69_05465 [Odoribacter sp.]|nr:hypothetical protein [Odoribacter sp.]
MEGVADGTMVFISHQVGMMNNILGQSEIKDGRFEVSFILKNPEFIRLTCHQIFNECVWVKPGNQIALNGDESYVYSGDECELNNLLTNLSIKYAKHWPAYKDEIFDSKRGKMA